jgi:pyroglutamyl-peptidase
MKTVLLTGFEPFGGISVNPSEAIARQLNGTVIAGHTLQGEVLPCVFGKATVRLRNLIQVLHPTLVICLGVAVGRAAITPERVAVNIADARIPDNEGQQPVDRPVVRGGPTAYWSTLPIKAIVRALRSHGIPAELSQTAGTFVCNHVFYGLMHQLAVGRLRARGGFVHLPAEGVSDARQPGLPLETIAQGIWLAIETSLTIRRDLREVGGAL